MIIAIAILPVLSAIKPIIGVHTAPPIMAIIMNEPPSFVFRPKHFTPNAKIVGNMSDIKKLVRKIDQTPTHPGNKIPMLTNRIFASENKPIKWPDLMYFIRNVAPKRPIINAPSVTVRNPPTILSERPVLS